MGRVRIPSAVAICPYRSISRTPPSEPAIAIATAVKRDSSSKEVVVPSPPHFALSGKSGTAEYQGVVSMSGGDENLSTYRIVDGCHRNSTTEKQLSWPLAEHIAAALATGVYFCVEESSGQLLKNSPA